MPETTIEFTDPGLAELRSEAEERHVAVEQLAHDALIEAIAIRRQQ